MEKEQGFFNDFMFRAENGDWFIKPICDFFGLDYDNQCERISNDKICQTDTGKFLSELVFGDKRTRLTLRNRGFSRWVQMTNASSIRVELREKFEIFQANIFSYLWEGNIQKTEQLEDIRTYAININSALKVKDQVMEYISEQKNHRNLCLQSAPEVWAKIKPMLTEDKQLPAAAKNLKAIEVGLSNDKDELMRLKKNYQTNILKDNNLLIFSSKYKQPEENPMPDGFRKETIKLRIKECEVKIEEINQKLLDLQN